MHGWANYPTTSPPLFSKRSKPFFCAAVATDVLERQDSALLVATACSAVSVILGLWRSPARRKPTPRHTTRFAREFSFRMMRLAGTLEFWDPEWRALEHCNNVTYVNRHQKMIHDQKHTTCYFFGGTRARDLVQRSTAITCCLVAMLPRILYYWFCL